jgi:hypothetical protein
MEVFTTPVGKLKDIADKYKKSGETIRISMPIEYDGKRYREIVYNKTFLGKMKKNIAGVIFLTEDGEYISNSDIRNELSSLAYNFEVILDDKSISELKSAITSELKMEKQIKDYELFIKEIENMNSEKVLGIGTVVTILNKLPNLKRESNNALEAYINKLQEINPEGFVFNVSVNNELYAYYREILIKNFQKVRLIASGRRFYDDIKKEAQKKKKSLLKRFSKHEAFMGITNLQYEMDHFIKIVEVYEKVIDMNQEQYIKYLKAVEKTNIKDRIQLLR